ncbi:hypothetical protein DEO72_LG2g3813 [Vigna unguiculata]|uniref:Uncharacterized protein n=1 Tax=Vigna unguiculata TaxID=3917 RepID=A0A4D6L4Q2_VIGUN|nr:hypothetical protein DEO72_LG2g3813 [Vigna unguiculata]
MAHHARKTGGEVDLFAKIRDKMGNATKAEGQSQAPNLVGPVVDVYRPPTAKRLALSKMKGVGKDRKRLRALAKTGVEAVDPGLVMRALNEYMARGLVLSRRVTTMLQEELSAGDKKKHAEKVASLKKLRDNDQQSWAEEKKKSEAEAVYSEHVNGFQKALRRVDFLYKEVSVSDCRFNINLDVYDNHMLDVAEISHLRAEQEVTTVGNEEVVDVASPVNVEGVVPDGEDGYGDAEDGEEVAKEGNDEVAD